MTTPTIHWVHTLIVGSGAAGLNAAARLKANGIDDLLVATEGLDMGTSINTGSDKQTYYKLSLCGAEADSPRLLADAYFAGGGMHGDLALVEASLSARAFMNLVNLGVPFPQDAYGQFVGYKTDHDPRQRATSIGPHTSREMCRALIRQARLLQIPIRENLTAVELLTVDECFGNHQSMGATVGLSNRVSSTARQAGQPRLSEHEPTGKRIGGAVLLDENGDLLVVGAENVVFAVGGPGGLYEASAYPTVHTGGIGLALRAGAAAQSLSESQFGMSSVKFRWNVSGAYMQVVPRFFSAAADGGDEREFLLDYFDNAGEVCSLVFLKGYQWPFDSRKALGSSSLIDILVHIETAVKGRRVYLDFRRNPQGFCFQELSVEALEYLTKSNALRDTPIERLRQMNPGAIQVYADHRIDLAAEPLEIAVCAQHNNGGLAGNLWWESINVKHLFPVGEVNGSHGVYRPGGSALNAGQAGSFRAAEFIANRYAGWTISKEAVAAAAEAAIDNLRSWIERCGRSTISWQADRETFQRRMTRFGGHIRELSQLSAAVGEAWRQFARIENEGCGFQLPAELPEALKTRYLCLAHAVYLESLAFTVQSGVGSRGSSVVLDSGGAKIHQRLDDRWRIAAEDASFREKVQETVFRDGAVENRWVDRRPIPRGDEWFETAWARFREGEIYSTRH
jgi:succinate dehydrogenase/fumarate reductase flavoprotein subunit